MNNSIDSGETADKRDKRIAKKAAKRAAKREELKVLNAEKEALNLMNRHSNNRYALGLFC